MTMFCLFPSNSGSGRRDEAIATLRRTYPPGADLEAVADDIVRHLREDHETHTEGWRVRAPSPRLPPT